MVALGSFALADVTARISDKLVYINNETIADEIAELENSDDQSIRKTIDHYKPFVPMFADFAKLLDDGVDDDSLVPLIEKINDILIELYSQANLYKDISIDDEDNCMEFIDWTIFWSLMLTSPDEFKNTYPIEILSDMPEYWIEVVFYANTVLDNCDLDDTFPSLLGDFAKTLSDNTTEILEILSDEDLDEDDAGEKFAELIESNIEAVSDFVEVLDSVTDYLIDWVNEADDD